MTSQPQSTELLPCAHCGQKALFRKSDSMVCCGNSKLYCRLASVWFTVEQWNTRTPSIEKVRAQLTASARILKEGGDVQMNGQPSVISELTSHEMPAQSRGELKSVEEWVDDFFPSRSDAYKMVFRDAFREIQLNAFKAGMTEAAEICHSKNLDIHNEQMTTEAILSARDKKETI